MAPPPFDSIHAPASLARHHEREEKAVEPRESRAAIASLLLTHERIARDGRACLASDPGCETAQAWRPSRDGILAPPLSLVRWVLLYELRRYDVAASKLPALLDRFGSFTVHKWKEYGFRLIGFWTPLLGEKSNQIVYIWGWESYEERTKKNAAWRADPERAKKWAETEKDGPLVNRV